jgi:hypothetical protein
MIEPCDVPQLTGRMLAEFCPDCHHVVGVHTSNGTCSACEAVEAMAEAGGARIDPEASRRSLERKLRSEALLRKILAGAEYMSAARRRPDGLREMTVESTFTLTDDELRLLREMTPCRRPHHRRRVVSESNYQSIKALADRLREHRTDFDDDLCAAALLDHLAAAPEPVRQIGPVMRSLGFDALAEWCDWLDGLADLLDER